MPNSQDYIQLPNGKWELKQNSGNPSTIKPIQKRDGWVPQNDHNNPSHLTTSPRKLKVISAREAIGDTESGVAGLWSPFLYEKSIAIINSVSGVGKTTLCYNLAVHGAKNEPFAGVPFQRSLNVLYADLETSAGLRATKLRLIVADNPPDNLYFVSNLRLIDDYDALWDIVLRHLIDLVIIDTLNEAFDTKDEQDNAEANRQFAYIKKLRDEAGCAILLLAHIGKGEQSHKVYSTRGASARAATADVILNLIEITDDQICLSKEKDRFGGGKEKLYLRRAGEDTFEAVERGEDQEVSLLIKAERFALDLFDEGFTQTGQFIERGIQAGYTQPTIERALSNLRKAGKTERLKKGVYRKLNGCNNPSENPSINNNYRVDGFDGMSVEEVKSHV